MNIRVDDDTIIAGRHVTHIQRNWVTGFDGGFVITVHGERRPLWRSRPLTAEAADELFKKCSNSLGERSAD